eukprot:5822478-Amphidinium_carterae.1
MHGVETFGLKGTLKVELKSANTRTSWTNAVTVIVSLQTEAISQGSKEREKLSELCVQGKR